MLRTAPPALPQSARLPDALNGSGRTDLPAIVTGAWGVDLSHLDHTCRPGDDFYHFVNGSWIETNPIPPGLMSLDQFTLLAEQARSSLREIVEELARCDPAPGTHERRIVDCYKAFLDAEAQDRAGLSPARPFLARIEQARSLAELIALSAQPGFPRPIAPTVVVDPTNPRSYIVSIVLGGLGLPGRDYYLHPTPRHQAIRAAYADYLSLLLARAGYHASSSIARQVIAFEHKLAELHWSQSALRNPELASSVLTVLELHALAPAFPTAALLKAAGIASADRVLAAQVPPTQEKIEAVGITGDDLEGIGGGLPSAMLLLTRTPLPVLKAHLTAHFLNMHGAVLGSELDDARFALYDKLVYGREQPQPRWKRALATVEAQLGELLGAEYVARYFPPSAKAQVEELVGKLLAAMGASIAQSAWMSERTKREALAKLAALDALIGHADSFEAYDSLAISGDDPLANAIAAAEWEQRDALARLDRPVDRKKWPFVPQTVNACYRHEYNQIVLPAGILQPPFFDPEADLAVNYGAIGAIIGHEIGHGFDDQGSKYNGTGALSNWWQDDDRGAFTKATDRLVEQFSAFCPLDDGETCVNGRLTLGENIGDLVGLEIAYRAFHLALGNSEAPLIDGLAGDQRFFLAFAQLWRGSQREEVLRHLILTDPHSPHKFRVNGTVRNMDAWYRAFGVGPDRTLYLAPDERVRIW